MGADGEFCHTRFNCAAPFRERLAAPDLGCRVLAPMLQLCRPLSGAVSRHQRQPAGPRLRLQLCRPLSGAVRRSRFASSACPAPAFNCAAPFRERLGKWTSSPPRCTRRLQLCRPLSGAVSSPCSGGPASASPLQLCRPLSGAVSGSVTTAALYFLRPSIVPPPFGSG